MSGKMGDLNEPDLSFQSANYKVRWAEKQIGDLERAIDNLFADYLKTGGGGYDPQSGLAYIRNAEVHPVIPCLAGDIVFSLRSALDCCWMGLLRAMNANTARQGGIPRGPISNAKATIQQSAVESAFPGIERFLLDELQPHEGGNETLWFVSQVDNWNKHNMLVMVAQRTVADRAVYRTPEGFTVTLEGKTKFEGWSRGHNVIAAPASGPFKLEEDSNVNVEIILKSRKPPDERLLMPFLRSALVETRKGVDDFVRLFGKIAGDGASPN